MGVKVFILGRPGSGKSTAARHMIELASRRSYQSLFVQDYDILYKMFIHDKKHERFRPTERGGFDVIDYSILDSALRQMEEEVENSLTLKRPDMVCIEFARDDYRAALNIFSSEFLRDAYIFFIDSDLEYCIQRVQKRVTDPPLPDHHFVSEYVMRTYYSNDNREYMVRQCEQEHVLCKEIVAVRNDGLLSVLLDEVSDFTERIFQREFVGLLAGNRSGTHLLSLHEVDHM
jgi:energy-coupling factor transporter ATP-binding protein EcfA2